MPLLCISLLALLLLPLSLSCDSERPPKEVRDHYIIVQTDIINTNVTIAILLQNSSCPVLKQKQHNCMSANVQDVLRDLHLLTCQMKNLSISHADGLITSVLNSIHCTCLEKPTKEHNRRLKRRTATRQRGNKQKKRETKTLCRAEAILSAMTNCYQMLNTMLMDT